MLEEDELSQDVYMVQGIYIYEGLYSVIKVELPLSHPNAILNISNLMVDGKYTTCAFFPSEILEVLHVVNRLGLGGKYADDVLIGCGVHRRLLEDVNFF